MFKGLLLLELTKFSWVAIEKFICKLVHKKLEFQAALLRSQVCSFVAGSNAHFVVAADENFKF